MNFTEGQKVICINDHFPWLPQHGGSGEAEVKPKKGEVLVIDEILGEFLRFNKYDTPESFNWWYYNRFAPLSKADYAIEELKEEFNLYH